jgi:hypothetical protein
MYYKARWFYGNDTRREKICCISSSRDGFAAELCRVYAHDLGDLFSFDRFEDARAVRDRYGKRLPGWFKQVTSYPVLVFGSKSGVEILCNPTVMEIVDHIRGADYGDLKLKIQRI